MPAQKSVIRVLAMIETAYPVGPARNLIEFACEARKAQSDLPQVEMSITTFQRGTLHPPHPMISAARDAGIPVDVILERYRFDTAVLSDLRGIVALRQPDILQSHNVKSHFLIRWAGLHRQYPWVAFQHGYTATDFKDQLYNQVDRWSLRAADRVVAVCQPFLLRLRRMGVAAERVTVLHNTVKPFMRSTDEEVCALRNRLKLPAGETVILSAGRLSFEKGHRDLVESVAILRQRRPDLQFHVVLAGEGPERNALERLCASLGLSDTVLLVGQQRDLRPYYSLADLMVLPSHSEGSPNVLLEAVAAGIPVVATAVGGVPEIVANESSALLVEKRDTRAMAKAIERLLDNPAWGRTLAGAAADVVTRRHRPDAYHRTVVGLYQEMLLRRRSSPKN